MSMAFRLETTSQWPAICYVQHQTFIFNELNITPPHALAAGNSAPHSFITGLHKIYAFILPALLAMLQVQGVGNTTSPFQVRPVTTGASVFGMLGYYLAFMASLRYPSYATQSSIAMAVFGSLSLASLGTHIHRDVEIMAYQLNDSKASFTTYTYGFERAQYDLQHCRGHHRGNQWLSLPTIGYRESHPRSWLLPLYATTSQIREPSSIALPPCFIALHCKPPQVFQMRELHSLRYASIREPSTAGRWRTSTHRGTPQAPASTKHRGMRQWCVRFVRQWSLEEGAVGGVKMGTEEGDQEEEDDGRRSPTLL